MHTWRARMYTHALIHSGNVGTTPWIVHHTCARLALHIETANQGTQRKLWSGKPKRCKRLLPRQALMRRAMDRSLEDRSVAVGTGPCATGERPSRQDLANLHPGMQLLLGLCCCLVTLATVQLMLWPIIFLASSGTVSGCMAYILAPFA